MQKCLRDVQSCNNQDLLQNSGEGMPWGKVARKFILRIWNTEVVGQIKKSQANLISFCSATSL